MHKKTSNILFTIILSFVLVPIFAQNGTNPFDLTPRLKEQAPQNTASKTIENTTNEDINNEGESTANPFDLDGTTNLSDTEKQTNQSEEASIEPIVTNSGEENPFDLKAGTPNNANTSVEKPIRTSPQIKKTTPLPEITKTILPTSGNNKSSQRFLFRVVLFMLILLTLLITLFRSVLAKTYQAFLNDNILSIIYRERASIFISPYTILYAMFLINAGIFVFLLSEYYQVFWANSRFLSLLSSIGLVFAIFSLKHLILELLAFIFPITKEVRLYNFTIIVFGIIIGILLVPANILIAYAPHTMTSFIVYVAIGLVGLVYLFRSLRGLFIANRFLLFHKFHFLLYICTVEITPIIIFLKLLQVN